MSRGFVSPLAPVTKNVARTPFAFRMSRIFGVHSALGPSSKVSATLPATAPVRRMT